MKQKIAAFFAMALVIVSNLIDTIFTLKYIKFGPLIEANPVMRCMLDFDAYSFIFYKIIVVTLLVYFLWSARENKLAKMALFLFSVCFSCLLAFWVLVIFLL
jgi:hypothetical protein